MRFLKLNFLVLLFSTAIGCVDSSLPTENEADRALRYSVELKTMDADLNEMEAVDLSKISNDEIRNMKEFVLEYIEMNDYVTSFSNKTPIAEANVSSSNTEENLATKIFNKIISYEESSESITL